MKRSNKVPIQVCVLFAILLASFGCQPAAEKKMNILFIFVDDLGYLDVGYNGSDYYETPRIDRFAKENLVFPNAYAGGSNCAPSRACLISGQYPPRTEVYAVNNTARGPMDQMRLEPVPNKQHLSPTMYTMAHALQDAGYRTGIFGKWHLGDAATETDPANTGFDVVMDHPIAGSIYTETISPLSKKGTYDDPKGMFATADSAISFMKANKDKPFFAFLSHHAIHSPHQTRAASFEKFKNKTPGEYNSKPYIGGLIYDFDETVGQVLDFLKESGLDKNTMVVFTSDNGGTNASIQEPLRGNKGSFYEGGIRVPFIVRWPGKTRAGVNNTPVINLDLFPTFAALASADIPSDKILDGENLLPLFSGERETTHRDKIFWHFPGYLNSPVTRGRDTIYRTRPVTTMRKGDYKILLYHEEWLLKGGFEQRETNNAVEIYDLTDDPGEHNNIASAQPEKRDELISDMLAWMTGVGAKWPAVPSTAATHAVQQ